MLKIVMLIIFIIIITSYIFISKWNNIGNNHELFENIIQESFTVNTPTNTATNTVTNTVKDLKKEYSDILNNVYTSNVYDKSGAIVQPLKYEKKNINELKYNYPIIYPTSNIDIKKIFNNNKYSLQEQYIDMKVQSYFYNERLSLEDPINDSYLPYSCNIYNNELKNVEHNNYEYIIISLFKNILDRNPTAVEITKYTNQFINKELDETLLRINLLNSEEYKRIIKMQTNDVSADIEYQYAKEDLLSYINKLYFTELNKEPPKIMLLPLRDIYTYLQNNEYLFRAFLIHNNYHLFEKDIMNIKLLTKTSLAELFNKYFILYDLKLKANDIKKFEILAREKPVEPPQNIQSQSSINMAPVVNTTPNIDTSGVKNTTTDDSEFVLNMTKITEDLFDKILNKKTSDFDTNRLKKN